MEINKSKNEIVNNFLKWAKIRNELRKDILEELNN